MKLLRTALRLLFTFISAGILFGGGTSDAATGTFRHGYTVGGSISGLATGGQVTLLNNGANALTLNHNGTFTFTTRIAFNGSYAVTVSKQPPGQICSVAGGTGSGSGVTANVTSVRISCSTNTYTIGGSISGLATGAQVTLLNNGADALTLSSNGAFTFVTPIAYNGSYAVTVSSQPSGQTCSVADGTGSGVVANVGNVSITCSTPSTSWACITSVIPHGTCGPYANYAQIIGANSLPYVDQNVWGADGTYHQTLYANSPGDWYVTANANTNFGGVLTYPNTGFFMTNPVDSFSSVTSSWNVTIPKDTQTTAGWAAYDLWFNDWADEVMIQTDITANSFYDCTPAASATFGGMQWHLCVFGSERVWKPGADDSHLINRDSGTVDVQAILVWMEQNGYLPPRSTWTAGSFGFEVCDTHGVTEIFQVHDFSWNAH